MPIPVCREGGGSWGKLLSWIFISWPRATCICRRANLPAPSCRTIPTTKVTTKFLFLSLDLDGLLDALIKCENVQEKLSQHNKPAELEPETEQSTDD